MPPAADDENEHAVKAADDENCSSGNPSSMGMRSAAAAVAALVGGMANPGCSDRLTARACAGWCMRNGEQRADAGVEAMPGEADIMATVAVAGVAVAIAESQGDTEEAEPLPGTVARRLHART